MAAPGQDTSGCEGWRKHGAEVKWPCEEVSGVKTAQSSRLGKEVFKGQTVVGTECCGGTPTEGEGCGLELASELSLRGPLYLQVKQHGIRLRPPFACKNESVDKQS